MKKKNLIICPHLSTGGLPSYALEIAHSIVGEVRFVEVNNLSDRYTVQRKKIAEKFVLVQLNGQEELLFDVLQSYQPQVIYYQEIPSDYLSEETLQQLCLRTQHCHHVVTSHNLYADFTNVNADSYVAVSEWQKHRILQQLPDAKVGVWEFPIQTKSVSPGSKRAARNILNMPDGVNVVQVGLWNSNKNQTYTLALAKEMPDVNFHFVGNRADNYQGYWKHLEIPDNCTIWEERGDVELFYEACDALILPSKSELNPIAIKEAQGYGLPCFVSQLPVYHNVPGLVTLPEQPRAAVEILTQTLSAQLSGFYVHFIDGVHVGVPARSYDIVVESDDGEFHAISAEGPTTVKFPLYYFKEWFVSVIDATRTTVFEHRFSPRGKKILVNFGSKSLGDTIAWAPALEAFQTRHDCQLVVTSHNNDLLRSAYPSFEFVEFGTAVDNLYAKTTLGWFYDKADKISRLRNPLDPKKESLTHSSARQLGVDVASLKRPRVSPLITSRPMKSKYICLGIHSTAQAKYWNYPEGWQILTTHLKSRGYEVVISSREPDGWQGNKSPQHAQRQSDYEMATTISYLDHAEAFIGIGSGLSWLAYALETPLALISGFSEPYSEMAESPTMTRVTAPVGACQGCFNKERLSPHDWLWCPEHRGTPRMFECSRLIEPRQVMAAVDQLLSHTSRADQ